MIPCLQVNDKLSNIGNRCLQALGFKKPRPAAKHLQISPPFNFQSGPAVNFPGYSEDDISLMREKAIASTAIVEDGDHQDFDLPLRPRVPMPRSRASSLRSGFSGRVVYHARRVSRGCTY